MENTEIMSTTSDSVNEIMESGNTMLQNAEGSLDSLNECLQSIQVLKENVCSSVTAWKEIDKEMLAMDLHFRAFEKEVDDEIRAGIEEEVQEYEEKKKINYEKTVQRIEKDFNKKVFNYEINCKKEIIDEGKRIKESLEEQ